MSPTVRVIGLLRLAVTLAAVGAIACGEENGGGGGGGKVDVAGAREELDKFKALPPFRPPGPAFDAAAKLRGKKIFEVPITSEVPFVTAFERGMRQAADAVGAELVVYRNQGEPSQWIQGIRTAI